MTRVEIRRLFDSGKLVAAQIKPRSGDWIVEFVIEENSEPIRLLNNNGEVRFFKSVDSAWRAIRAIGFEQAVIQSGVKRFKVPEQIHA